jgi:NADH dehydrogenase FAD-containing subunit
MTDAPLGGHAAVAERSSYRVVVAGGGIAGAEALLALCEPGGDRVSLTLVEPRAELQLTALEPGAAFGMGDAGRLPISEVGAAAGAVVVRDTWIASIPASRAPHARR